MTPERRAGPWGVVRAGYLAHERDGPLPALLLALTLSTGLIDAMSVLGLGRVFVANMTGNVVFLGLALVRAPGFSAARTVTALVGFVAGAFAGGVLARRSPNRGRALRSACGIQIVLIAGAIALAAPAPHHLARATQLAVIVSCAVAMGLQNATARHLAVPELATNVLTTSLTRLAADAWRRSGSRGGRELLSVLALFLGACLGAVLVVHTSILAPLAGVIVILIVVLVRCQLDLRHDRSWLAPTP